MSCCFSVPTSQFFILKDWQDNSSISLSTVHLLWTWIKCGPCSSWPHLYYKFKPRLLRNTDHMLKITLLLNNVTEHISLLPSLWQLKYTFNHCLKIQYMRHTWPNLHKVNQHQNTIKKKVLYEYSSSEICFLSYSLLKTLKCPH
jgi:hypothetical protein